MAYIQGFEHDIFISYCHIDNEESNPRNMGWVEKFYNELRVSLRRSLGSRDISIWWDSKRLNGGIVFDDEIAGALERSAILICLNSPSFLHSDYCRKELDTFCRYARQDGYGLQLKNHTRVLNLLLFNIPHTQWPKELSGSTGFGFHDAGGEELGDTLSFRSRAFKDQLHVLKDAILALIKEFGQAPEKPVSQPVFSIYFGDVSDSLSTQRDRAMAELKKKGYVIHSDVPPPYEAAEHEKAVRDKLEQASLSVHLLDQFQGRKIAGEGGMWYPQKQLELSLDRGKPKLIWVPEELAFDDVDEEKYREFLGRLESGDQLPANTSFIRGKRSRLVQEILDQAAKLVQEKGEEAPASLSVMLDAHYVDEYSAYGLCRTLAGEQIHPLMNPQEIDPRVNMEFLQKRIRSVSKLVFFYGKVSGKWIEERLISARQYIIESNYPVKDFIFLLMPPEKNPEEISLHFGISRANVINNSDSPELRDNTLKQLLERIKAVS